MEAKEALNALSEKLDIELRWIKAHKGILDNEIADRAAKLGTKLSPTITTMQTKEAVKDVRNNHAYKTWNERWKEQVGCR